MGVPFVGFTTVKAKTFVNSPYNQSGRILLHKALSEEILQIEMAMYLQQRKWTKTEQRQTYPYGSLFSHVIGYNDSQFEKQDLSPRRILILTQMHFLMEKIQMNLKEKKIRETQLLQHLMQNFSRLAYDALGENKGAVIVMEADGTGKILTFCFKA